MDESQLSGSVTKESKMDDNPKPKVEEPGKGKEEALPQLSFDAAKIDREKIEVGKFEYKKTGNTRKLTHRSSSSHEVSAERRRFMPVQMAGSSNSLVNEIFESRMLALNDVMEALTCCDINTIGVWGPDTTEKANLLERVSRRAKRDNLFDVVVMARVTRNQNIQRIQDEIAWTLGFKFDDKDHVARRAKRLRDRIIEEERILVVLRDLCEGLDLDKVGIPLGEDHTGCKVLLTSTSVEVLSNKMFAQKIFKF